MFSITDNGFIYKHYASITYCNTFKPMIHCFDQNIIPVKICDHYFTLQDYLITNFIMGCM